MTTMSSNKMSQRNTMLRTPTISIIYPVFNESNIVASTLNRSIAQLDALNIDYEIIVVDDGSTDSTPEILNTLTKQHKNLRVHRNIRNEGQGASILTGMSMASKDYVLHNGIDYPFDLKYLERMFQVLPNNDIVVAIRKSYDGYPLMRIFISQVNRLLIRALFGIKIKDTNFVQLYKTSVVSEIPVISRSAGFVTTELILRAFEAGFRIAQIELPYEARQIGTPANSRISVIVSSLRDLLYYYFHRKQKIVGLPKYLAHQKTVKSTTLKR